MSVAQYGVILDAGSSGTRVYVYKWKNPARASKKASPEKLQRLPKLKLKEQKKIHPGVSTFAENVASVGPDHLQELVQVALDEVPDDKISETPIFLMATAGVRFLPKDQQTNLLQGICTWLQANTKFSLPDCDTHVQVISGETEGLYGWLAANYLLGGFDEPADHEHGKDGKGSHHTYGFLDMGGASAQIAFAPNTTEAEKHADDLKLVRMRHLDGSPVEYRVFTTTWLGFGANKARERYIDSLQEGYDDKADELPDPCLPKGLRTTLDGAPTSDKAGKDPLLLGTGKFEECLKRTYPLLGKDEPCEDDPCLLNGQHVPAIDFDVNRFVGVSEYWHTTHGVFGGKHKAYDLATYQENVMDFCQREWSDIANDLDKRKKSPEEKMEDAMQACFKASWLINVLYDGIGIPRVGLDGLDNSGINNTKEALDEAEDVGFKDAFRPVDKIDGVELSWTLGKMVLYAAGQIPPEGKSVPVGFGDNVVGGEPLHFEEAGSVPLIPSVGGDDDDDDDDWDLPKASKPTSGLVAFICIALFLAWLLRKPERRQKLFHLTRRRKGGSGRFGLRSLPFAGKFFGRNTPTYERILEEGDAAEFELGEMDSSDDNDHSDSSDGSKRRGRDSGLSTPKLGSDALKPPSALDRAGLVVRTESRERLSAMGRRSRTGSPSSRQKSSLMTSLQED